MPREKMKKCPECKGDMRKGLVKVEGATKKSIAYFCKKCDNFEFDRKSGMEVVKELQEKESPLKIKQKVIKLSHNRLGMYFNKNIVRSLDLEAGKSVYVSVPDKKHIVLNLE